jgi:outer membrane protein assembly factor BamB
MKIWIFFIMGVLAYGCTVREPEINEWRGKNRSGIYNESGLLTMWPEGGPKERWVVEGIGHGYGSPVITGDGIYITGEHEEVAYLYCIHPEGKIAWRASFGPEWTRSNRGSRSAPTVVGDLVYAGSGYGNLYCFKRETGETIWSKDFEDDFQGEMPLHGHADAPVISGDKVFWVPGGKEFNVVALNRYSGALLWKSKGYEERSGYTPSKLIHHNGKDIFITFSAYTLMGIDAETGELLWVHKQDNMPPEKRAPGYGDTHSNTPLYEKGAIYYQAGDGNGGVKLMLSEDGTQMKEIWRNREFDGYMGGIVKIGDHLYGTGTLRKELLSLNAKTGTLTDSLKIGSGVVIAAHTMLYYYNQRGELYLIATDQGKMHVVNSFKMKKGTGEHFSHPVINDGILYQRHGNVLMAFDI